MNQRLSSPPSFHPAISSTSLLRASAFLAMSSITRGLRLYAGLLITASIVSLSSMFSNGKTEKKV
jgi:hypothetical protein